MSCRTRDSCHEGTTWFRFEESVRLVAHGLICESRAPSLTAPSFRTPSVERRVCCAGAQLRQFANLCLQAESPAGVPAAFGPHNIP